MPHAFATAWPSCLAAPLSQCQSGSLAAREATLGLSGRQELGRLPIDAIERKLRRVARDALCVLAVALDDALRVGGAAVGVGVAGELRRGRGRHRGGAGAFLAAFIFGGRKELDLCDGVGRALRASDTR